jgi:hypothetical protein
MRKISLFRLIATFGLVAATWLSGCGGGGGSTSTDTNTAPIAVAGPAQSAVQGTLVTLDGSASADANGDALSYLWTLTLRPTGSAAALNGATTAKPSFAPDLPGVYSASLVVNDGRVNSSTIASVSITVTPDPVAQADRALATAAKLGAVVDLAANTLRLEWTDSFPAGTSYRVESQERPDAAFGPVETLAGSGGTGAAMAWTRALTVSTTYRVQALVSGRTVSLLTSQGAPSVAVTVPGGTPQILVNMTEPLSGSAQLAVGDGSTSPTYRAVTWYADLKLVGTGAASPGNPVSWNTATATNGAHLILARVETSPDARLELRRTLNVVNSNLAVNASVSGKTGSINVDVRASSQYGIAKVEAAVDGKPLPTLTTPNACSARFGCGTAFDAYRFTLDASALGSGSHVMVVTATDLAGARQQATVQVPVANPPQLSLTSPVDGAFVNGTLLVSGAASTDKTGAVTVVATLGDYPVLQTSTPAFNTSFSLSGLAPGAYTLTLRATDSAGISTQLQRTVTVASSSALTYPPLFTPGAGAQLVAVDNTDPNLLLYKALDGSYRVRNASIGTEVTLQGADSIPYLYNWAMDGGYVFVEGGFLGSTSPGYTDCPLDCIFQWSPAGARTNLSNANPNAATPSVGGGRAYEQFPRAHGGYVIWIDAAGSNPGTYTIYKIATGSYTTIRQPVGANYLGNTAYDFAVINGVVHFFFWGQTGGDGTSSSYDVYRWQSDTQASTRLSAGGLRSIYPQTDGLRVAWLQSATTTPVGSASSLVTQSVAGGALSTVSSNANESFVLRGGVLAWVESTPTTRALKASTSTGTSTSTSTLSVLSTSVLYGAGGGFVVYGEAGKTNVWNAALGSSKLLIDGAPSLVLISGATMYFVMGASQTVYRVVLR